MRGPSKVQRARIRVSTAVAPSRPLQWPSCPLQLRVLCEVPAAALPNRADSVTIKEQTGVARNVFASKR